MWPFSKRGASGFNWYSTAEQVTEGLDGSGLTAIVTGASSGIGTETARVLAMRGVHVIMAVRNVSAGNGVKDTIVKEVPTAKLDVMELDLTSLASVRKFASEFSAQNIPLNILINNAGVMATPFSLSKDGIELQFATNHVGHFLLTHLLLENMKDTSHKSKIEGRIVNVSSEGHRLAYSEGVRFDKINGQSEYNSIYAYGQSKLANILHANELCRRFQFYSYVMRERNICIHSEKPLNLKSVTNYLKISQNFHYVQSMFLIIAQALNLLELLHHFCPHRANEIQIYRLT